MQKKTLEADRAFLPESRENRDSARKKELKARQIHPPVLSEPASSPPPNATAVKMHDMAAPASEMLQDQLSIEIIAAKPWRATPQQWLQQCQRLLTDSNWEELSLELSDFRRQHVDYELPQNLSLWLERSNSPVINP